MVSLFCSDGVSIHVGLKKENMNINSRYMDSLILSQAIKFVPEYRTIIMKRLLFIFTFFCLPAIHGGAQNILTLENCLRMGIENNLSLQGKRKAMQKSKYGISENRVKLLPQINGFANFNDNIDPPVSVTDGSSYGVPYNITRTLQYSANAGVSRIRMTGRNTA